MIVRTQTITRKRFTADEFHHMWDAGIFPEDKRFELIRGVILEMPAAKPSHSGRVNRLNHLFTARLGESATLSIQNPAAIDDYSEPSPDVSLLKPRGDFYTQSHPLPEDVLLLIEISDTTLRFDTRIKSLIYAEAGIPEYWILNIPQNVLEVRTEPANGRYTRHELLRHGQTVSPLGLPGESFWVDEILG